jgi:hypothetical protein
VIDENFDVLPEASLTNEQKENRDKLAGVVAGFF